ncbi:hypothetical protein ACFVT8_06275 [Lysinibacillus sp. NPDC058147]|uniref:hypothetical protein n=1 Tax=unclassified Lysinibacillus TaxID=2636778 RepID=UPI0036DE57A8
MIKEKSILQLDLEEIIPVVVSKNEKQKVINTVLQKKTKTKKTRKWAIASIFAIGISSTCLINFPSVASKLLIKDLEIYETLSSKQHEFIFNRISISGNSAYIYFSCDMDFATEFITLDIVDNLENKYEETTGTATTKVTDDYSNGQAIISNFNAKASAIFITPVIRTLDNEGKVIKERLETIKIDIDSYEENTG